MARRHHKGMSENPFFEAWSTPFGAPPFDRIRPEHYGPAFDAGMAAHFDEIEAIANDPRPPDFDNTIVAMERAGRLLTDVGSVFFNLAASEGSETLRGIERDYAPKLAEHASRVALHEGIFARVGKLHAGREASSLEPDQRRLLERAYLGFVRAGAALAPEARRRMAEISQRLATLHTQFGQNVLHDEREWFLPLGPADLDGLPDFTALPPGW